ncbi:hypothetical protein HRbin36_02868 [bacterium HR36]|nr:hypothetical protein HRbin36_02868 [bacterium HR36]
MIDTHAALAGSQDAVPTGIPAPPRYETGHSSIAIPILEATVRSYSVVGFASVVGSRQCSALGIRKP